MLLVLLTSLHGPLRDYSVCPRIRYERVMTRGNLVAEIMLMATLMSIMAFRKIASYLTDNTLMAQPTTKITHTLSFVCIPDGN